MFASAFCTRVEYDTTFTGGRLPALGDFAYVPTLLIAERGLKTAFSDHTGVDPIHIVHCAEGEHYDADGFLLDESVAPRPF